MCDSVRTLSAPYLWQGYAAIKADIEKAAADKKQEEADAKTAQMQDDVAQIRANQEGNTGETPKEEAPKEEAPPPNTADNVLKQLAKGHKSKNDGKKKK